MSEVTRHSPLTQLRRLIAGYPTVFGVLIGLILFLGVIGIGDWFPRVSEGWEKHNEDVRSAFFTFGLFAIMIFRFWHFHRRGALAFWVSISSIFVLHTIGVILYSSWAHPLLLRQWLAIIIVEPFIIVFALDWLTKRFGRIHNQTPGGAHI